MRYMYFCGWLENGEKGKRERRIFVISKKCGWLVPNRGLSYETCGSVGLESREDWKSKPWSPRSCRGHPTGLSLTERRTCLQLGEQVSGSDHTHTGTRTQTHTFH